MEDMATLSALMLMLGSMLIAQTETQTVYVNSVNNPTHAPDQAVLQCDVSLLTVPLTELTWIVEDVTTSTNQTLYIYSNITDTGEAAVNSTSRVDGYMNGTIHTLRINTTSRGDAGAYYCTAMGVNNTVSNITVTNATTLDVYYTQPSSALILRIEGISSSPTAPVIYRSSPHNFTVTCTLPNSYPKSDYYLSAYSYSETDSSIGVSNLIPGVTETVTNKSLAVTGVSITLVAEVSQVGRADIICRQIYPFKVAATPEANLTVYVYGADYNACISSPCQNGGVCQNYTTVFNCTCDPAYIGVFCETVAPPPCDSNPCVNGGVCTEKDNGTAYNCTCTQCYSGATCDQQLLDPCANVTCATNFKCSSRCPKYVCECNSTQALCDAACALVDSPPASVSVLYGDSHTLLCSLPSITPVTLSWYRNNQLILQDKETLNITSVDGTTRGTYRCALSGSCTTSSTVQVSVGIDIRPNNTAPQSLNMQAGHSDSLICRSEGRPEPWLYWEWIPDPEAQKSTSGDNQTSSEDDVDSVGNANTTTTTTVATTTAVVTQQPLPPQRLTEPGPSPAILSLKDVTVSHSGTYICRANVKNLTAEDIIILEYDVTVEGGDNKPDPDCCPVKKGLKTWMLAIIVLIVLIIIVVLVVILILLLFKGKKGEGPFVCCFMNSVHPDVKDREKDTQGAIGPAKYAATYADEMEMDRKEEKKRERSAKKQHHIRRHSNADSRHLVGRDEDDTPKSQSDDDSDDRQGRRRRSKTPSPHSQNPIGSRAGALPPLDVDAERKRQRKKKARRNRERREEEDEQQTRDERYERDDDRDGSGDESPSEQRRNFRYRERDY